MRNKMVALWWENKILSGKYKLPLLLTYSHKKTNIIQETRSHSYSQTLNFNKEALTKVINKVFMNLNKINLNKWIPLVIALICQIYNKVSSVVRLSYLINTKEYQHKNIKSSNTFLFFNFLKKFLITQNKKTLF